MLRAKHRGWGVSIPATFWLVVLWLMGILANRNPRFVYPRPPSQATEATFKGTFYSGQGSSAVMSSGFVTLRTTLYLGFKISEEDSLCLLVYRTCSWLHCADWAPATLTFVGVEAFRERRRGSSDDPWRHVRYFLYKVDNFAGKYG